MWLVASPIHITEADTQDCMHAQVLQTDRRTDRQQRSHHYVSACLRWWHRNQVFYKTQSMTIRSNLPWPASSRTAYPKCPTLVSLSLCCCQSKDHSLSHEPENIHYLQADYTKLKTSFSSNEGFPPVEWCLVWLYLQWHPDFLPCFNIILLTSFHWITLCHILKIYENTKNKPVHSFAIIHQRRFLEA